MSAELTRWRPRSVEVVAEQRDLARQAWTRDRQADRPPSGASREQRMDAARRAEALEREFEAMTAHLDHPPDVPAGAVRAVIAHRNTWFTGKFAAALAERGIVVVAAVQDGADAVGITIAEQPDLLLVEDVLARLPGSDVVRRVRQLVPDTLCLAQVGADEGLPTMLEAGAQVAWTRKVPPGELAGLVAEVLQG
ncbi:MAG: hypothetical protein JWL64_1047 [Frankiales bacterium]|nr:hypothetical protein [Frankiales bacterium]